MALQDEIDARVNEIHTDGYPMSIGELISIYQAGEMDIHPEFQRFYRWTPMQKSKLIESILLGIPIPSIFVSQRKDGVWDVIDGLQRISTIFEFVGILKDKENALMPPLELQPTKYLPALGTKVWDSEAPNSLTPAQRLIIKRSKIDIKIILNTSTEGSKYELFQRLNTGGSQLSDQELRNCMLIGIDPAAYRWLEDLTNYPAFFECLSLSERLLNEQYHMELALRFLILIRVTDQRLSDILDIGTFLTDQVTDLAVKNEFVRPGDADTFRRTFDLISQTLGAQAFQKFDPGVKAFKGPFLISAFECLSLGIAHNIAPWAGATDRTASLMRGIAEMWRNRAFTENIGSGKRASQRIPKTIPLGRQIFHP